MALSNWDTLSLNQDSEPTNGSFTSPLGVEVSVYKNWLYVRDPHAWQEGGRFIEPIVMQIEQGTLTYKDVQIVAIRGPQNGVYAVIWSTQYHDNDEDGNYVPPTVTGMIGIGVSGFEEPEDAKSLDDVKWVGVKPESLKWFIDKLNETEEVVAKSWVSSWEPFEGEEPDEDGEYHDDQGDFANWSEDFRYTRHLIEVDSLFRSLDWSKASRFNQGDMFFAEHGMAPLQATEVGAAEEPQISGLMDKVFEGESRTAMSPIDSDAEHLTLQEFIGACNSGAFTDDDGIGYYATETEQTNLDILPSDTGGFLNTDYTHVVWYNK